MYVNHEGTSSPPYFCNYGRCSKILNTFLFLFPNEMLVFIAGIHKMFEEIANREDTDQTASSEAVYSGSALLV